MVRGVAPAPKPDPAPPVNTPPPADLPAGEPEWAANLRALIEELPGKLTATVTPDDRNSIAEGVYGLLERAGAVTRKDEQQGEHEDEQEDQGEDEKGGEDQQPQQRDSLARRWFGPH